MKKIIGLILILLVLVPSAYAKKLCLEFESNKDKNKAVELLSYSYGYPTTVVNDNDELVDNPQSREDYVMMVMQTKLTEQVAKEAARRKSNEVFRKEFEDVSNEFKGVKRVQ